ncbi:hypothetical protein [Sphingomonas aquatilis]
MTRGADIDVVAIKGPYRIQKDGRRGGRQHCSFSAAEAEALRLTADNPGDTFIITQEVARVQRSHPRRKL